MNNDEITVNEDEPSKTLKIDKVDVPKNGEEVKINVCCIDTFGSNLTLRKRIESFLNSNLCHILIIGLVLLDTICVSSELVIIIENKNKYQILENTVGVLKYIGITILGMIFNSVTVIPRI